ncbi:hypothetical protein M9979_12145 [Sphingomonas sp. RP10(2022)]|uniref:Uncharacterized protein n=1 Tax=Sphingomonas liriopis TaxID=2949094 RepID=A0A9X2KQD3_9SPHN|nr:hypothetical protein [Sphingomonas liriopis]MCP3735624.1 hypothetical protein [Sphingomonas liriopis]
MATITSIAIAARNVRSLDTGVYSIDGKPALPAVAAGDRIVLFTAPHAMRLTSAHLRQTAGMGASATLKLQKNSASTYTDLTASTTAATAGVVNSAGLLPIDLAAGDTVEVLVSGGASAAGVIEYDILARHA